jgi:hypothetical protein
MGLFSALDSRLILNIVPHCPSMSHTREYFHITVKLKDINDRRLKKMQLNYNQVFTGKAETENHFGFVMGRRNSTFT